MRIIGVIPARYGSSRFPGKPLMDICGKPMIWWVYQQVLSVKGLSDVIVATDDKRIVDVCNKLNINVILTSTNNKTSTERIYEVSKEVSSDLYICINGDEPLIKPDIIEAIIPQKSDVTGVEYYVSNLMTRMNNPVEVIDTTNIKVVTDVSNNALYMSRNPIPSPKSSVEYSFYKHLGVLIYNSKALEFFANTTKGKNEIIEDINELRFIENGIKLKMVEVNSTSLSVDTPKDLEYVKKIIKKKIDKGELSNE